MADLVQNTALVAFSNPSNVLSGTSNAAITAGQPIYSDGTYWYPAVNSGNALQSGTTGIGIALNSAPGAGQPINYLKSGAINLGGAILTAGQTYIVSGNSGKVAPITDAGTNNYVTILGIANTTSNLNTPPGGCLASGVQHA